VDLHWAQQPVGSVSMVGAAMMVPMLFTPGCTEQAPGANPGP
jgi:hypothetical protein